MILPPVRYSWLKHMARSPAHVRHALDHAGDDTRALRLGRATHSYLLGGDEVILYEGRRAGAAWEAFESSHPGAVILIASEMEHVNGMRESLHRHDQAMELLSGPHREETIRWKIGDRDCQSTPDVWGGYRLTELKTTKCADPERFKRDAIWRGYHGQASFYQRALLHRGFAASVVSIVAVESTPPYPVTILELTPRALEAGEKLWRGWFERLLVCEASNYWPAYSESIVEFDVEDSGETTIVIDGEDVPL